MRVVAIDQGTTSTRALAFENDGAWSVAESRRHAQYHPSPGWVEHDPEELLRNVSFVAEAAGPADVLSLANQGESCLAWDLESGRPLSPVIVWQDRRTTASLQTMPDDTAALSRTISGLPLDPYFSASKLGWMLKHLPEVEQAACAGRLRLGTTDAFILDRLCGCFATDVTTASRTGLMDLATFEWSRVLCDLHGVPIECLPPIRNCNAGFGSLNGLPMAVSMTDQQAALYGHECYEPGAAKVTFGTGAFLLVNTGGTRPNPPDGLLPTIAWSREHEGPTFAVEGGVYDAGSAVEWARRLGLFTRFEDLAEFKRPNALGRGLVFVPAFSGLAAPYWDREAAPLMIGMAADTDRTDITQALLEGVCMLTAGLVSAAASVIGEDHDLSIDGGLSQSPYFVQFLATACERAVRVAPLAETTALGLARMAGWSAEITAEGPTSGCRYSPGKQLEPCARENFARAISRARNWRIGHLA